MAEKCPNERHVLLSEDELKTLVNHAVQDGIHEGLLRVGLDTTDPVALQRDFLFIRDLRKTADTVRSRAIITGIGLCVTGILALIWLGFRTFLSRS